jgi:hypothetical protein
MKEEKKKGRTEERRTEQIEQKRRGIKFLDKLSDHQLLKKNSDPYLKFE